MLQLPRVGAAKSHPAAGASVSLGPWRWMHTLMVVVVMVVVVVMMMVVVALANENHDCDAHDILWILMV